MIELNGVRIPGYRADDQDGEPAPERIFLQVTVNGRDRYRTDDPRGVAYVRADLVEQLIDAAERGGHDDALLDAIAHARGAVEATVDVVFTANA